MNQSADANKDKAVSIETDWKTIRGTHSFQELMRQKRAFIVPATVFFFIFYFTLPFLTAFTTVLNGKAVGAINWAYIYAFAQFAMTWGLSHLYIKKANQFDQLSKKVKEETVGKGGRAA